MKSKYKIIIHTILLFLIIPFSLTIPNEHNLVIPSGIINSTCLDCELKFMYSEVFNIILILFAILIVLSLIVLLKPIKEKSCNDINKNKINLE